MRTYISVSRRWKKNDGYVEQAGSRRKEEGDWGRKERRRNRKGLKERRKEGVTWKRSRGFQSKLPTSPTNPRSSPFFLFNSVSLLLFSSAAVSRFPLLSFFLLRHFQKGNRIHVRTPVKRNALPVLRINRLSNNFPLSSFLTIVTTNCFPYHSVLI